LYREPVVWGKGSSNFFAGILQPVFFKLDVAGVESCYPLETRLSKNSLSTVQETNPGLSRNRCPLWVITQVRTTGCLKGPESGRLRAAYPWRLKSLSELRSRTSTNFVHQSEVGLQAA
jgi:hypothetical protein